ncbi:MAG TPA: putative quinol monooxygenase [Bauldia sp.]|nr:putative quinol monooxygenase [Bauldia sp.]
MILVTGHFQIAPEKIESLRPAARRMMEETAKEDGCILYAFAEDLARPGVVRIVERWRDWPSLEAHGKAPHMADWRAVLKEIGVLDRSVIAHEAASEKVL